MARVAAVGELRSRADTTQTEDEVAVRRREDLVIPLTAHDARQVVPAILLLDLEAIACRGDTPCGSSFLEVRLSRRSVDLREAHRETHTHRVGIRTPLSGVVAIGTVELVRLAVVRAGSGSEDISGLLQLGEHIGISLLSTYVGGVTTLIAVDGDDTEVVTELGEHIDTPDTSYLLEALVIGACRAVLDALLAHSDSVGEGLEAFLSHAAIVVGAPAVTEATYGKTTTTVLMTARLPVEDEGTLRHVGILLGSYDRAVDEVLGEHLILRSGSGVGIDFVEVAARGDTHRSAQAQTPEENILLVHDIHGLATRSRG